MAVRQYGRIVDGDTQSARVVMTAQLFRPRRIGCPLGECLLDECALVECPLSVSFERKNFICARQPVIAFYDMISGHSAARREHNGRLKRRMECVAVDPIEC